MSHVCQTSSPCRHATHTIRPPRQWPLAAIAIRGGYVAAAPQPSSPPDNTTGSRVALCSKRKRFVAAMYGSGNVSFSAQLSHFRGRPNALVHSNALEHRSAQEFSCSACKCKPAAQPHRCAPHFIQPLFPEILQRARTHFTVRSNDRPQLSPCAAVVVRNDRHPHQLLSASLLPVCAGHCCQPLIQTPSLSAALVPFSVNVKHVSTPLSPH